MFDFSTSVACFDDKHNFLLITIGSEMKVMLIRLDFGLKKIKLKAEDDFILIRYEAHAHSKFTEL